MVSPCAWRSRTIRLVCRLADWFVRKLQIDRGCESHKSLETLFMKWRSLEESQPGTDLRPLREILAERKELIAKYVPAQTQAVHEQAVAELKARALAAGALAVGAKAPPFEMQDHDGNVVRSSDLLYHG